MNMKTKAAALAAILALPVGAHASCFLKGEYTEGLNKICLYDCVRGTKAITIRATSLCPLSLYRDVRFLMGLEPLTRKLSCGGQQ